MDESRPYLMQMSHLLSNFSPVGRPSTVERGVSQVTLFGVGPQLVEQMMRMREESLTIVMQIEMQLN